MLSVLAFSGIENKPHRFIVQDEQINGATRHARSEALGVYLYRNCAESFDGHFPEPPDQKEVHVVGDFVNGTAHQIVGTQNPELVLDFVVVVAKPPRCIARTEQGVNAVALLLIYQNFRGGLVHVHQLVCHKSPPGVADDGHGEQEPPILTHQLEVGSQIFKADEGSV